MAIRERECGEDVRHIDRPVSNSHLKIRRNERWIDITERRGVDKHIRGVKRTLKAIIFHFLW